MQSKIWHILALPNNAFRKRKKEMTRQKKLSRINSEKTPSKLPSKEKKVGRKTMPKNKQRRETKLQLQQNEFRVNPEKQRVEEYSLTQCVWGPLGKNKNGNQI